MNKQHILLICQFLLHNLDIILYVCRGFYRNFCCVLLDIDECASSPCVNGGGVCVDGVNRYTCNCNSGRTGVHCELGKLKGERMVEFSAEKVTE